jgi:NAD(P) transhydrogenase
VLVCDRNGHTSTLHAERVLLAVGSRPHHPDHVDFSHSSIVDSTSILELERMPRSLVVVGGGVIGSEYASIFAEMGVHTTVIEPRSTLMRFLDEECRDVLVEEMTRSGIDLLFGTETRAVHPMASGAEVELTDGTRVAAEVVLWTLGREGNTNRLGLETVSIQPNDRGLLTVDASFRTSCPGIWAAGDVVGFPGLASTSMQQAGIAVDDMFELPDRASISNLLPMGIYTIPAVASIGPTEAELLGQGRALVVGRAEYRRNARGRMLGDDKGIVKLVFDRSTTLLLHATIVGEDATELVHLPMMAIAKDWTINDFRETCFTYPSLGALFKSAANRAWQRIQADWQRNQPASDQAA